MSTFEVKAIVDKRIKDGTIEYKVRWEGFTLSDDTWEPVNNLNCSNLINEYEIKIKSYLASDNDKKYAEHHSKEQCKFLHEEAKRLFDDQGKPDKIIGTSCILGEQVFMVKWRDGKVSLVPNFIATTRMPKMVIQYYESSSKMINPPSDLKLKPK